MESFFDRVAPFFPPGRQDLHWHILPTGQEAEALAAPYTRIIPPGLRAVPTQWMHCTLLHAIGLSRDTVDTAALVQDVQHAVTGLDPFLLTFDRPAIGTVALEVSGWPARPFDKLVDLVSKATARTGASYTPAPSRYPHMSIAYASTGAEDVAAVTLKAALAGIEQPLSETEAVDRLHLVAQWHDGALIRWEPIAEVPLR